MALVAVGGESVAGDKKQPARYSDCSMCGADSWMLQLVSDALQPVADAACDAAVRGIMTSSCGRLAHLHVHFWVPWQRERRAGRGRGLWLCVLLGGESSRLSCRCSFLLLLTTPLLFPSSSLPRCCRRSPPPHPLLPFFISFTFPSSANQSAWWGQGLVEPPFQSRAAASPQANRELAAQREETQTQPLYVLCV